MPGPSIRSRQSERGNALIWALLFVVLTSGIVISHATFLRASRVERESRYNRDVLADTFAQSGMTELMGWYQRQAQQPVTAFNPLLDPEGDPPRFDTIDPTVGLVREFEISGNLWGRYEVRHEDAVDISSLRGGLPAGTVWEVGVRSYVYRIVDPTVPFDQEPNRMVATTTMANEIRRMQINLPSGSALITDDPGTITLGRNAKVDGRGGPAVAYADPATVPGVDGVPTVDALADVDGSPSMLALSVYDADARTVFEMRLSDMRAYSDALAESADGMSSVNWPVGKDGTTTLKRSILYVNGNLFSDVGVDLEDCVVVVDGDLYLFGPDASTIKGVVYVTGDAILESPLTFTGSLIVRGQVRIGTGSYPVTLEYDSGTIEKLRKLIGKYRKRRSRRPKKR